MHCLVVIMSQRWLSTLYINVFSSSRNSRCYFSYLPAFVTSSRQSLSKWLSSLCPNASYSLVFGDGLVWACCPRLWKFWKKCLTVDTEKFFLFIVTEFERDWARGSDSLTPVWINNLIQRTDHFNVGILSQRPFHHTVHDLSQVLLSKYLKSITLHSTSHHGFD